MTAIKIPYQTLIQHDDDGVVRGAHHQFREVIQDETGVRLAERLLPAIPFGSDPSFPVSTLLGQVTHDALSLAEARAMDLSAAENLRNHALDARDAALAERDAAVAEKAFAAACADEVIAQLQAQIAALTAVPERPAGKWWEDAVAFLAEFTPEETLAIARSDVPLISKLLMTLLAWRGEIWAADQRIQDGLQALVATEVLTEARRQAILT